MQLLDVRPDHLRLVREILRKHVPEAEVWVFGSRAKWLARDTSDLDLCIRGDVPLSFEKMGALREAFEESDLPWKVDVVDWATTSESFRKIIDRDKVEVQGSGAFGCGAELITRPLEECLEALIDYRGKTPKKADAGIPLITAKVVKSGRIERPDEFIAEDTYEAWMTRGYPEVGDVVLTTEAPLGEVAQIKFLPVALAQRVVTLRGKKEILDNGYLLYLLQTAKMQEKLIGRSSGTTVLGIKQSELRKIEVTLPPVKEQRAIARILGALDDKIEVNRRLNGTQETMARALFKAWFVDFEPVRAKIDGRWQSGQSLPGLPADLFDLFPSRFVESELGEIPEGWEMRSLDSIANYLNGLALQKFPPESEDQFLPVIKIAQLRAGNTNGADRASARIKPEYVVVDGDVLFSWSGSLEVDLWCGGLGALNQHLFKVTSSEYPKWLYYLWTRHHLNEFRRIAAGKATTMGHIQRGHLSSAKVLIPPPPLLESMDRVMAPLIEQIIVNRVQSRTLAALRDSLLPKLLSGELRISDAEHLAAEAEL
ncbi:MAG: restriction endonuclease subunit S [Pseudomonadota bacterium]